MQVRPVCTELHVGKSLHVLPRHERAECATIRSYTRAYHLHEIRFSPFPELAARREVRRWRWSSARAFEIFTMLKIFGTAVESASGRLALGPREAPGPNQA